MRSLDLFSGIGGFALGFESIGAKPVGFCEIEPFPRAVLAHHWPGVPIHDDIKTLSVHSVPWLRAEADKGIDIICGGFPCQPHSVAGKRKGVEDERHLWPEYARLVREIRPRWVLAENVPGIRSTAADEVIGDLEAAGYEVWPFVVGADNVGAPHRRKRVWFLAHLKGAGQLRAPQLEDGAASERGGRRPDSAVEGGLSGAWPGWSEVDHSHTGRREWQDRAVQARRDESQRAAELADCLDCSGREPWRAVGEVAGACAEEGRAGDQSAQAAAHSRTGVAHGDTRGPQVERIEDGDSTRTEYEESHGDHADRCSERPVGQPSGEGLEVRRARSESARTEQPECDGAGRWPARPGEPQYEWEEPRLAYGSSPRLQDGDGAGAGPAGQRHAEPQRGSGLPDDGSRSPEQPVGGAIDEFSKRLVRAAGRRARAANREALKAYGNAVVPALVARIAQAIQRAEGVVR